MLPILHIGPLAIQFPGLVLLLGIWLGLSLAEKYIKNHGQRYTIPLPKAETENLQSIDASVLYNLVIGSLLAAILGARLLYVLMYTQVFIDNPASIISLNLSLLDARGAILGAIIFALFYGQRRSMQLWPTLDALTPALAVFAISFHLANLASGNGFGAPTQMPWGIELWGDIRHPVQLYEAVLATLILIILWPARPLIAIRQPGEYFLYFTAMSAASRLFLEAFHGDSPLLPNGIRIIQVFAWLFLALSFYMLHRLTHLKKTPLSPDEKG
jgi:prolipoprotein diacylglyceryltransferase